MTSEASWACEPELGLLVVSGAPHRDGAGPRPSCRHIRSPARARGDHPGPFLVLALGSRVLKLRAGATHSRNLGQTDDTAGEIEALLDRAELNRQRAVEQQ